MAVVEAGPRVNLKIAISTSVEDNIPDYSDL